MAAEQNDRGVEKSGSCWGCLFRSCLGFLALAAGASAALLLFGPSVLGGLAREGVVDWFNSTHDGSLEIEEYHMALFSDQELLGVRLIDPAGQQVLTCDVTFPGWLSFDTSNTNVVTLKLDAEILVDPNGVSNIDRALHKDHKSRVNLSLTDEIPLEIQVDDSRLVWRSVIHDDPQLGRPPTVEYVESLLFDRIDGQVVVILHGKGHSVADLVHVDVNVKWAGGEVSCLGALTADVGGGSGYGMLCDYVRGRPGLDLEVESRSDLGRILVDAWGESLGQASGERGRLRITASSLRLPLDGWPGDINGELTQPDARVDGGRLSLPVDAGEER